jgi:hypothetical protein
MDGADGTLSFATALEEVVRAADAVSSQSAHRRDGVTGMRISPTSTMQPAKSRRRSTNRARRHQR